MKELVVITGITKGLGLAMFKEFDKQGYIVAGCGRNEQTIYELQNDYPGHSFSIVDITSDTQVKEWSEKINAKYGAPLILINNAGLINKRANLWEINSEEFSNIIDVNIKGIANSVRHLVPAMIKNNKGKIINFSSGWGRFTEPQVAPYCATKFAVEGLSMSLAQELPAGMICIPLSPGIINTDMLKKVFGSNASNYEDPDLWAKKAVKFILDLKPENNGQQLEIP